MAMLPQVASAAGAGAPAAEGAAPLGPVAILLVTIVFLLGLFALGAVLLARSNHRQAGADRRSAPQPPLDAWREAGRRLTPPPEAGEE
jgi:hypothetical protein